MALRRPLNDQRLEFIAIELGEEILRIPRSALSGIERVGLLARVGDAYAKWTGGARGENLEKAIESFLEAVSLCSLVADSRTAIPLHHSLGRAYLHRMLGNLDTNHGRAMFHFEKTLHLINTLGSQGGVSDYEVSLRGNVAHNLGVAYLAKPANCPQELRENLKRAIQHLTISLQTRNQQPLLQAETERNLGVAMMHASTHFKDCGQDQQALRHVEDAISQLESALSVYETFDEEAAGYGMPAATAQWHALTITNLATALTFRKFLGDTERARGLYRDADERYQKLGILRDRVSVLFNWGLLEMDEAEHQVAYGHFIDACHIVDTELARSETDAASTAWLSVYIGVLDGLLASSALLSHDSDDQCLDESMGRREASLYWSERFRSRRLRTWISMNTELQRHCCSSSRLLTINFNR